MVDASAGRCAFGPPGGQDPPRKNIFQKIICHMSLDTVCPGPGHLVLHFPPRRGGLLALPFSGQDLHDEERYSKDLMTSQLSVYEAQEKVAWEKSPTTCPEGMVLSSVN